MRADAVLVTGPSGFVAAQQAIGALQFMSQMADITPEDAFGDSSGCLQGAYTTTSLKELLLRQARCARSC